MALIDKTVLQGIADRLAWQSKQLVEAFDTIDDDNGGAGTGYFERVSETDDADVEIPLVSNYNTADAGTTARAAMRNMTTFTTIVTSMDTHFSRVSQSGSWDGYCTAEGVEVSSYFNDVYYAAKNQNMLANNVFYDGLIVFGDCDITSTTTIDFTDGWDFGDGDATNRASEGPEVGSTVYYAPTQLQVYIPLTGGQIASGTQIVIDGKDESNATKQMTITPSASSTPGFAEDIGTTTDLWLDVTDVTVGGSNTAATGVFQITNKLLRTPAP